MNRPDVILYAVGLLSCSACAPAALTPEEVTALVNQENPTGVDSPWQVSTEPSFTTGQPNPCPCNRSPSTRMHYLMEC